MHAHHSQNGAQAGRQEGPVYWEAVKAPPRSTEGESRFTAPSLDWITVVLHVRKGGERKDTAQEPSGTRASGGLAAAF